MTKVKGRLTEWIEAKVRALATPPKFTPTEKAPPHVRISERGSRAEDRHGRVRRGSDARGHRARRVR